MHTFNLYILQRRILLHVWMISKVALRHRVTTEMRRSKRLAPVCRYSRLLILKRKRTAPGQ